VLNVGGGFGVPYFSSLPIGANLQRLVEEAARRLPGAGLSYSSEVSGNFWQIIRKNYPVAIGNKVRDAKREIASVVGPLCTPLDPLADRMELARADEGDLVVVFQSGAYGLTASPINFLIDPAPREALV